MYQLLSGLLIPFVTFIVIAAYGTIKKRNKFIWQSTVIFAVYAVLSVLTGGAPVGVLFSVFIGMYGLRAVRRNDSETIKAIFSWITIMAALSITLLLVNPWGIYR